MFQKQMYACMTSKFQLHSNERDSMVCKFSQEKCGINVVNEMEGFWY